MALPVTGWLAPAAALDGADGPAARNAEGDGAGRLALARAMSRYAGVIRDADGLGRLLRVIAGAGAGAGATGREERGHGAVREEHALVLEERGHGAVREEHALVLDAGLEDVEAANLRTVSLLIAAGAARRTESRGCHRRRDAGATGAAPWHTLLRWDGQRLVVTEELVMTEEAAA
jgi:succinate dehydrogenase/fumarate reductase flavoprotein subunit